MNSTIENFKKYKPLLFELVSRDLKTKYRRSVLGVLWTVLNPLGMMLVMTVVSEHREFPGIPDVWTAGV